MLAWLLICVVSTLSDVRGVLVTAQQATSKGPATTALGLREEDHSAVMKACKLEQPNVYNYAKGIKQLQDRGVRESSFVKH